MSVSVALVYLTALALVAVCVGFIGWMSRQWRRDTEIREIIFTDDRERTDDSGAN